MLKVELSYRGLIVVGLAILSLWALVRVWPVVLLLLTALILMAALLPYVEWLVRHGFNRVVGVLLILLTILVVIGSMVAIVAPAMIDEFRFTFEFAGYAADFEKFKRLPVQDRRWICRRWEEIHWGDLISGSQAVTYGSGGVRRVFGVPVQVLTAYMCLHERQRAFLFGSCPGSGSQTRSTSSRH